VRSPLDPCFVDARSLLASVLNRGGVLN
jgi:hypothetical protein